MASLLRRIAFATARSSFVRSNASTQLFHNAFRHIGTSTPYVRIEPSLIRTLATAAAAVAPKRVSATRNPAKKSVGRPKSKAAPKKKKVAKKPVKKVVRKRLPLTDTQKEAAKRKKFLASVKALKEVALETPKQKNTKAYALFVTKNISSGSGVPVSEQMKTLGSKWRSITAAEREELNIEVQENLAENQKEHDAWLKKHTPEQIRLANSARKRLKALSSAKPPLIRIAASRVKPLKDSRQVKRPASAWIQYYTERRSQGVFDGIPLQEATKLAATEYKALGSSEKKKYLDLSAADTERYQREYQSTYGHQTTAQKKAATRGD